jgi:hypothetical protein
MYVGGDSQIFTVSLTLRVTPGKCPVAAALPVCFMEIYQTMINKENNETMTSLF